MKSKKVLSTQEKILLLGSGALKIGEAGEFDYSGTQAIKALKEEGKQVILINPNVATIQTSEGLADEIYFLPVTPFFVEKVIKKEKPSGILLSFGGQTALNCGMELAKSGVLEKYNVRILGTPIQAVIDTEDRELFSKRLAKIGLKTAKGKIITSAEEGMQFAEELGFPVMLRTGFALGGTGSGVARDRETLQKLLTNAFATAPQVILEESLEGWKEIEYEVVRDQADNCITVCNMENFDPVGIHTGESIVIAPSQTLNNHEYFLLRQVAIDAIRELKIVGECNIQYAVNPKNSDYRIIEVNARLSRSSALASKATGYPLAYIAAKLALGKNLPDLQNLITQKTSAFFEPALDYVVVKIPRWDLDKYSHAINEIGSEMKSVGEVMAIGRTFEEAIQKGARMLNDGYEGVLDKAFSQETRKQLTEKVKKPNSMRLFTICSAMREGVTLEQIHQITGIDMWFLAKLKHIVAMYQKLSKSSFVSFEKNPDLLLSAKQLGFSDRQIGGILKKKEDDVRTLRKKLRILPVVKRIDTMAGEFPAKTNYLYLTYHGTESDHVPNAKEKKAMVIGGGPYSIGTSVEFDWCAVNTIQTLKKNGLSTVMINCNPETVSTDYDNSDYLYFEVLSLERILDIWDIEQSPCVVSVGGQIPNNLAPKLATHRVPLLGTKAENIYRAEDRKTFSKLLDNLKIPQPTWGEARTLKQAKELAVKLDYPILVRPSFVLSGRAMSVLESEKNLDRYMSRKDIDFKEHPLVMSRFLSDATECDFDGVSQDGKIIAYAISEHLEGGGVHSGDSTLTLPAVGLSRSMQDHLRDVAAKIVGALDVNGPFNIQFLVLNDVAYVIECNLRASRSLPFVSKTLHVNFIQMATEVMLGKKVKPVTLTKLPFQAVKVPQFSFHKLRGTDPVLRVEMSSTGEVAAFGKDMHDAYLKGLYATNVKPPQKKAVLVSLGGSKSKLRFLSSCGHLIQMGFTIFGTSGTVLFLKENGIAATAVGKIQETQKHPNVTDLLALRSIDFAIVIPGRYKNNEVEQLYLDNTDGYTMRRMAIDFGIPIFTTVDNAAHFVDALAKYELEDLEVKSWSEYMSQLH